MTNTNNTRSRRRRIWWRDNFLMIIVSVMITAYFVYDLNEKQTNKIEHQAILQKLDDYNTKFVKIDNHFYTMTIILINDPNTDPMLREILIDYIKSTTRGINTN